MKYDNNSRYRAMGWARGAFRIQTQPTMQGVGQDCGRTKLIVKRAEIAALLNPSEHYGLLGEAGPEDERRVAACASLVADGEVDR